LRIMTKKLETGSLADDKLIKSLFAISQLLSEVRAMGPLPLATLSLEDVYNLLIEIIDLVKFTRRQQDEVRQNSKLNRGMMEINPSFSNVGGLIPITVKVNPIVPFTEHERTVLDFLSVLTINLKQLHRTDNSGMFLSQVFKNLVESNDKLEEFISIPSVNIIVEKPPGLKRKSSKKHNAYHRNRRKRFQ